ncbi:hypothetical protein DFH29DRAFT_1007206 [Suillus ampliporus]|nr:hypothetical protein DFH29DRAFT_1007206 [Suillus ampliporus]
MSALQYDIPDDATIKATVETRYNIRPCNFQVQSAVEQLKRKDVITIAPTGAGKTLMFWIPLLFTGNAVMVVITALNGLGDQNVKELNKLSLTCINITGENVSDELFKEIENLCYRVVIISPELVISDKRVEKSLWKSKKFTPYLFTSTDSDATAFSIDEMLTERLAVAPTLTWLFSLCVKLLAVVLVHGVIITPNVT